MYTYDLATGKADELETGACRQNDNDHVLSFDGKRLALSNFTGESRRSVAFVLPVTGSARPRQITSPEASPTYLHGWSPDGKALTDGCSARGDDLTSGLATMIPGKRDRLRTLFHEALELPPLRRGPFLDRACSDEPEVVREVLRLLKAHDAAGRPETKLPSPRATTITRGFPRMARPFSSRALPAIESRCSEFHRSVVTRAGSSTTRSTCAFRPS